MLISDLPYLEKLSNNKIVAGNATLTTTATAVAIGDTTFTSTEINVNLKTVGRGKVTIAKAKGSALAIGDEYYTDTSYDANGFDLVKAKGHSKEGKNYSLSRLNLIAIDLPW